MAALFPLPSSLFPRPFSLFPLHADQIPAARLRPVERAIRAVQKILGGLYFRLRKIGDADADGEMHGIALANVERMLVALVAQPRRKADRARFAGLRDRDHELVAAIARNGVDAASGAGENEGDLHQHLIASEVAEGVIDILELVDVDHQDAERRVVAA